MQITDFDFELPDTLIAHYPNPIRSRCRLLSLDGQTGVFEHGIFTDIIEKIHPGDVMVFNNTQVIPARLFGQKETGGKLELLMDRLLDSRRILAHIKASKSPKMGSYLLFDNGQVRAVMTKRHEELFEVVFDEAVLPLFDRIGHIPLPPYIDRQDEQLDKLYYQTVYGEKPGAVAAPTAGLHFDTQLIEQLVQKGVQVEFVTLHVGAGTFQPLRVKQIEQHKMHAEYVEVPQRVIDAVLACKKRGNRVIAVGTTSVRSLETAAQNGGVMQPFAGDTAIFIYPGYHFSVVDVLITNFHLPESTLIMLVAAFCGYQFTMNAYRQAIAEKYRFFSYGDAMFITKNPMAEKERI